MIAAAEAKTVTLAAAAAAAAAAEVVEVLAEAMLRAVGMAVAVHIPVASPRSAPQAAWLDSDVCPARMPEKSARCGGAAADEGLAASAALCGRPALAALILSAAFAFGPRRYLTPPSRRPAAGGGAVAGGGAAMDAPVSQSIHMGFYELSDTCF